MVYLYTVSVFILHTLFSKGEMLEHAASGTRARAKDNTNQHTAQTTSNHLQTFCSIPNSCEH